MQKFGHDYCKCYVLILYYSDLDSRSEAEELKVHLKRLQGECTQLSKKHPQFCLSSNSTPPPHHPKIREPTCNGELAL